MNCLDVRLVASFLNFPSLSLYLREPEKQFTALQSVCPCTRRSLCPFTSKAQPSGCNSWIYVDAALHNPDFGSPSYTSVCLCSVLPRCEPLHTQVCLYIQPYPDVSFQRQFEWQNYYKNYRWDAHSFKILANKHNWTHIIPSLCLTGMKSILTFQWATLIFQKFKLSILSYCVNTG